MNLLANLIADGYLDIRIAITEAANNIGMYHEKMGIMEDEEGNRIAFTGSNNAFAPLPALPTTFDQLLRAEEFFCVLVFSILSPIIKYA